MRSLALLSAQDTLAEKWLRAMPLGSGHKGQVYSHPDNPNAVIKVTLAPDKAYEVFINMVQEGPYNPHFPFIHEHRVFPDGTSVTIMERLQTVEQSSQLAWLASAFLETAVFADDGSFDAAMEYAPFTLKLALQRLRDVFRSHPVMNDLCPKNIMLRPKTGEVVITDPFWGYGEEACFV